MKRLLLTTCFSLAVLFTSAQFMVMTTVDQPDKASKDNKEWGLQSFTNKIGLGYQVNDTWMAGVARNGDEDFEMLIRYMYNENLFISLQAPVKDASDNADLGVGYSFNAWNGVYIEPNYSMPLQKDAAGKREGAFNIGLGYKF